MGDSDKWNTRARENAFSEIKKPPIQRDRELRSVSHDVIPPNQDSQFRELAEFRPTEFLRTTREAIRIFDIEEVGGIGSINAHV